MNKSATALLGDWEGEQDLQLIHESSVQRKHDAPAVRQSYDDILTAFSKVPRAVLLGAPGAGKSTTLRKLAVELAQEAMQDAKAPLPVLVPLGSWTKDEPLLAYLDRTVPASASLVRACSTARSVQGRV